MDNLAYDEMDMDIVIIHDSEALPRTDEFVCIYLIYYLYNLMHHKAIKAEIRKQLKIRYLNWHRLSKQEKKAVAKKVLNEVVANFAATTKPIKATKTTAPTSVWIISRIGPLSGCHLTANRCSATFSCVNSDPV